MTIAIAKILATILQFVLSSQKTFVKRSDASLRVHESNLSAAIARFGPPGFWCSILGPDPAVFVAIAQVPAQRFECTQLLVAACL